MAAYEFKRSASQMANDALADFYFTTTIESKQMFYYDKTSGIWRPHAEELIRTVLRKKYPGISYGDEREVIHYIEDVTFKMSRNFQQNKGWIATKKGEFYFPTMDYSEGFDPTHNIRIKFDVYYEPRRKCPQFMKFMREILPDPQDRLTVLECLSTVFIPEMNLEKAYMFIGGGANGKSTLFNVFKALMDEDSYCSISIHSLIYNRFSAAELEGRIANIYPDINSTVIKELDRFKMIVSGETMTVERKGRDPNPLKPMTKHFFSANQPPEIKEDTDAVFRRFIMVEFKKSFLETRNIDLSSELIEEKSGIFNLLLQVANCLKKRKRFCYEQSVGELRIRWKEESNPVYNFINDDNLIIHDESATINKTYLYNQYVKFCSKKKYVIKQQREFTIEMQRLGFEEKRTGKERLWRGLRLNVDEKAEDQTRL